VSDAMNEILAEARRCRALAVAHLEAKRQGVAIDGCGCRYCSEIRNPANPEVPMLALTPELQEAIETAALAYSEYCGIASDECNKHVRIISEAIAAAQKSAMCEAIADRGSAKGERIERA
jgi:hypothetical protein